MIAEKLWRKSMLNLSSTVRDAVEVLNRSGIKIVLILDPRDKLLGIVTDGDIRRGLLNGIQLDSPVSSIMQIDFTVVMPDVSRTTAVELMKEKSFGQLPVVNAEGKIIGLHLWDEIVSNPKRENVFIIMAGGKGTRLLPFTEDCPKPMVRVQEKPMMQHIIERGRAGGFKKYVVATHYLGSLIQDYFGDGSSLDVSIEYLTEREPLGTAGALRLLNENPSTHFIVSNGDVLSDINYGDILDFHIRNHADATMAVRLHEFQQPFGVINMNGIEILGVEEKPITYTHINAGIYVLNPDILNHLPESEAFDMTTLFSHLKKIKKRIIAYPMYESWLDVGRPDDLRLANSKTNDRKKKGSM